MQTVIQVLAYGGPLFLALMGVFVIDHRPPNFHSKLIWYGGFIFVAFLATWAAVKAANDDKKEMISMIMGSNDDFPIIFAMPRSDGKSELFVANGRGPMPLYDVNFNIKKAGSFASIASKNLGTLANFAYDLEIAIDKGSYQIDFGAKNGLFTELMYIGDCDGKPTQVRSITKPLEGGRVMQESPNYKHCMGIPESSPQDDNALGIGIPP